MGICSASSYLRIILKIIQMMLVLFILFFASKDYYEATKSKDDEIIKLAQRSFNIKALIVVFIFFIPTFVLLISKWTDTPSIYECTFGEPKTIINDKIEEGNENIIEGEEEYEESNIDNY